MTRLSRLAFLLSSTGLLAACSVAAPLSPQEEEIQQDFAVSQYMPATRQMRDAIETQELFAQAAFWSREYNLNPSDLESAIKLASAVRRLGNPKRAVEITQTTRALYPRDPYLSAEFAAALIADERAVDAMEPLNQALSQAAGYGRLWSLKGAALDQLERYDEARQHYSRAMQITPNDPNVLANIGLSYALSGDAATAEGWLRRAVAQPGASATIRQNLALVLQLQGKNDEASRLISNTAAPQRFPTTRPLNNPVTREEVLRPPTVRQAQPQAAPVQRSQPTSSFASGRALRDAQSAARQAPQPGLQPGLAPVSQAPIATNSSVPLGRVGAPTAATPQAPASPEAQQELLNRIASSLQPQRQQMMSSFAATPPTGQMMQQRPQPTPQGGGYPQQNYAPAPQTQTAPMETRGRSRRRR
jgi:Flp pilus assembly protein TadD